MFPPYRPIASRQEYGILGPTSAFGEILDRPLSGAYLLPRRERQLEVVEPPAGVSLPMGVNDPDATFDAKESGPSRISPNGKQRTNVELLFNRVSSIAGGKVRNPRGAWTQQHTID
jgi:hypothetical protein